MMFLWFSSSRPRCEPWTRSLDAAFFLARISPILPAGYPGLFGLWPVFFLAFAPFRVFFPFMFCFLQGSGVRLFQPRLSTASSRPSFFHRLSYFPSCFLTFPLRRSRPKWVQVLFLCLSRISSSFAPLEVIFFFFFFSSVGTLMLRSFLPVLDFRGPVFTQAWRDDSALSVGGSRS